MKRPPTGKRVHRKSAFPKAHRKTMPHATNRTAFRRLDFQAQQSSSTTNNVTQGC